MKRVLLIVLGAFLFIGALSAYVLMSVADELGTVKEMFAAGGPETETVDLAEASSLLEHVDSQLDSLAARLVGVVPIVNQNLDALEAVTKAGTKVVNDAENLRTLLEQIEEQGAMGRRGIDYERFQGLAEPLAEQLRSIEELGTTAHEHLGPLLFPPVWDGLRDVDLRAVGLSEDIRTASDAVELLDDLVGSEKPRRYLVLLINNAELRGAGGVLTGVGTLNFKAGRISLGRFHDVHQLRDDPPVKVAAPADFERRFAEYKADTTLWLNTTFSPDVPDVARVAATLYKKKTGLTTDGAFVIDPVAISQLLPDDWSYPLPLYDRQIDAGDIDDFIFSDGYSLYADQAQRRATILRIGQDAFRSLMDRGFGPETLSDLGALAGGGHIRVTSLDPEEQQVLDDLGISGDLTPPGALAHHVLVTAQNFGSDAGQGTKLDHWARRSLVLRCAVADKATCGVTTTIENDAPERLPVYVGGDGVLRSYLETYVPAEAEIRSVLLDGAPTEFGTQVEEGQMAVGVYLELGTGEKSSVEIAYSAPYPAGNFRLVARPQPLSRPAQIDATVEVPLDWRTSGPGAGDPGILRYKGIFTKPLVFEALEEKPPGITRAWNALAEFWRKPLF